MARSVLRVADQLAGIYPERCVLSGVETPRAVRVTATSGGGDGGCSVCPASRRSPVACLDISGAPLPCPSANESGRCGGSDDAAALATLAAGVTFGAIGVVTVTAGLAAFGLFVVVAALAYRMRAHHDFWVTCTLLPESSTIVVEPTHPSFDEAARTLFMRTLS